MAKRDVKPENRKDDTGSPQVLQGRHLPVNPTIQSATGLWACGCRLAGITELLNDVETGRAPSLRWWWWRNRRDAEHGTT